MLFLNRVCSALAGHGVRYAIVGGHAVALHGAVRGTVDIDIALAWNLETLEGATRALGELGLVSRLPVTANEVFRFRDEYVNNRKLIAWNFYHPDNPAEQVDIVITYDLKGKRLRRLATAGGAVSLLGLKDLIEMKRGSGRPQDLEDVRALEILR